MTLLKVNNLSKTYPGEKFPALDDVSLEIRENSVFGFLGPNGAGKTTAIKILTGLMRPSRGEIRLKDKVIGRNNGELRSRLGYLSQEPRYYPWMTAEELLLMTAALFRMPKEEAKNRIGELLELTGLAHARNKRIEAFSGGMIQRLGLAQALVNRPEILFLDEPVSSMDPLGRREVLELIAQLKEKTTVFISTHILADVERVCDQVGILKKGRLIAMETTETLKKNYSTTRKVLRFSSIERQRKVETWLMDKGPAIQDLPSAEEGGKEEKPDRKRGTEEKNSVKKDAATRDSAENRSLVLTEEEYRRIGPQLLEYLGKNKIPLESMQNRSASLEEIFITLIGDENE